MLTKEKFNPKLPGKIIREANRGCSCKALKYLLPSTILQLLLGNFNSNMTSVWQMALGSFMTWYCDDLKADVQLD